MHLLRSLFCYPLNRSAPISRHYHFKERGGTGEWRDRGEGQRDRGGTGERRDSRGEGKERGGDRAGQEG